MGWADCGNDPDGRPIGYAFPATCDQPGCKAKIDRGLSYVCGDMHGGGELGCGKYFCEDHRRSVGLEADGTRVYLCAECGKRTPDPDDDEDDE